ncbi:MAG: transposase [Methanomassiliicoccales archaeon]|jgi:transposase
MQYVELDVHKEFCQASVLDQNGEELTNIKIPTRKEELESFLCGFDEARFVLESTGVWEFVYEIIEKKGFEVLLAHPMKVKAISSAKGYPGPERTSASSEGLG